MKHIKYFENYSDFITLEDMDDIEDIFKEYSDKYFISKTHKTVTPGDGDIYHIGMFGTEVIIDIYISKEVYEAEATNRRLGVLQDLNLFKDRLVSIGYEVRIDDNFHGFFEIRIRTL